MVDRLATAVAGGGPAAANLGRLAGIISAKLGYREHGSTAAADSARSYLGGAAQDPELVAAEMSLGLGRGADATPTATGLRGVGRTLGRQAHSAFEAMATASDVNKGNPALLPNVIYHQLGPMPRLLEGLVSGCAAVVPPPPSVPAVPAAATAGGSAGNNGNSSSSGSSIMPKVNAVTAAAAPPALNNKRAKDECDDADNGRPEKKMALGGGGGGGDREKSGSASPANSAASTAAAAAGTVPGVGGPSTAGSENGQGASSSPATAAPPAASNLLARPASADFRHGGGGELMALLKAKVGRLFSLDAEYTHVRMGAVPQNGTPAARGGGEGKMEEGTAAAANGSAVAAVSIAGNAAAEAAAAAGDAKPESGLRRVLCRIRAVRAGQFVVHIKFDVAGQNACRPCDVSVLSWNEAQENAAASPGGSAASGAGGANMAVKTEALSGGASVDFMDAVNGAKPWPTSQHTAFVRVSGHAFQVRKSSGLVSPVDRTLPSWHCTWRTSWAGGRPDELLVVAPLLAHGLTLDYRGSICPPFPAVGAHPLRRQLSPTPPTFPTQQRTRKHPLCSLCASI